LLASTYVPLAGGRSGIRFGCRDVEAQPVTEVERGRLVVLRIVVVTVGIAVAWLAGWRTGATMGVVVLATYIATLALPR